MQHTLLFAILLIVSLSTHAQRRRDDDTSHYRTVPVPAHLMPIERGYGSSSLGSVYFYGGKRLSSPYSLEIPFYDLNDPEVSHRFQTFRVMITLGRVVAIVPLAYTLVTLLNNRVSNGTYWTVSGASFAASITFTIIGNSQVNKAAMRYNELLRQPRIGMSISPLPGTGQYAVGPGITWSF